MITEMITKENYQRTNAANLKLDNVDINRHPVHVGYVLIYSSFYSINTTHLTLVKQLYNLG